MEYFDVLNRKRELLEEIFLDIDEYDYKYINTQIYKQQFVDIYILYSDINIENLVLQKDEVIQAKWVSLENFQKMIICQEIVPSVVERFKYIKKYLI